MSAATEISPTQKTQQTQQAPGQPVVDDGASKQKLRGMSYDEQVAALAPGATANAATPKPAEAKKPEPQKPQPPSKTRAQILKEEAGRMSKLEDLMSYGAFDWAVTDGEATKALNLLAQMPDGEAPVVIQAMNAKNPVFMKRLMENAPAGAKAQYPLSYLSIVAVSGQVAELEKMVGYHPSVYGVGKQHTGRTELAWVMQKLSSGFITNMGKKSSPPFSRWLELTPDPPKTGVEQTFKAAEAAEKDRQAIAKDRKADEQRVMDKYDKDKGKDADALRSRISSIEDLLSYSFTDWAITDAEAKKVMGMLGSLAGDQIRYAAMKLDKGPFMDRFIDNLNPADRWNNKKVFLNILTARSPEKNVKYVKELMSYGVFDWAITDEEARLAFYLVKTMPKDIRDTFKNADGGKWWSRMEGNLDQDTKTAKDAHFYNNAEEIQKKKLDFQEGAAKWPKGQLRMAIEMLTRMGEEDWVEKQIQGMGFEKMPEFEWLFTEMGFARTGGQRDPKIWKEFKEKSAGAKFVDGMKALGSGAKLLGQAIGGVAELGVTGKTNLNLDMQDLQNVLGGDVGGVKFAKNDKDKEGDNKLGLSIDMDKGLVTVNASSLSIASIATLMDTTRVQTGPVGVQNVNIVAKWPTPNDPAQFYKLSIGNITAKDIWQISETSMTGVGSISLAGFNVEAKMPAGDKPADKTQLLGQALTDIQESMTRLVGMIDAQNPQPEKIGMNVGQGFAGMSDAKVSLGALEVKDVTQSAGGHVGQVKAEGLELSITQKQKGDAVRARLAELAAKEKKGEKLNEKDLAEKSELTTSLPKIVALEQRQAELVKKRNDSEKKELEPFEKEELASIRDQLTVSTAEVGVKSLSVQDVDTAGLKAKSLEVHDLKGKITGEKELGDKNGVLDMNGTPKDAPKAKPDSKVKAEFSVGSMSGKGLVMSGSNKVEAYDARIAALKAKIEAKEGTEEESKLLSELKLEIAPVHRDIVERDRIKLIPEAQRTPADKASLVELSKKLEPWVGKAADTSIDEIAVSGKGGKPAIEGKLDITTGKSTMTMADAQVKGVKKGDLSLDSANIQGLSISAEAGSDLRMGADLTKTLTEAEVKVDHAELNGLKMGGVPQSKKLKEELDALALKAKLNPKDMTDELNKRLAELPALLGAATKDETRLAELRKLQQDAPANFTPDLEQELKALAERTDPQVTTVKHAELNDVAVKLDTKAGKIELGAGGKDKERPALKVEGVEIGQQQPDGSIKASTKVESAKIDKMGAKVKTDGGLDKLLDPAKSKDLQAEVSISGVEAVGLEQRGKTMSTTLQTEMDTLAAKPKDKLSDKDQKRIAELAGLIKQAKTDETRLIELRRIQTQSPKDFTKDMDWELKALATRLDPSYQKVAKVEVAKLDAKVDTKAGKVEVGIGKGANGEPGLKVSGVEMGKIGPDGKPVPDTKVDTVKLDTLSASVDVDPGTSSLFDPSKSASLKANVEAHGLSVAGVEKGKEGEPGHMKLKSAEIADISAKYDKADGGNASLEMQGAKLENFEMHSTKLATLESRMGELIAKGRGGQELNKEEKAELDKLSKEHQEYLQLKAKYATAKGGMKGIYQKQLEVWEKDSITKVDKASMGNMKATAKGLGDVTQGSPDMSKVQLGVDVDKINAEGVQAGDTTVKKAGIEGLHFEGQNLGNEDERKAKVSVKALEAEGLRMPGTAVGKAKVKGVDANLNGRSLDVRAKTANVQGAYSGGSGVGYANAQGIGYSARNMGTDKETNNTYVSSFNAGGITTGTKANGTTIKKANGTGLAMAGGKGYAGSGGGGSGMKIAGVNAEGIVNTSTDKDGNVSVAKVDTAAAKGVSVRSGKNMSVSVAEANVGGVSYDTTKKDGSSSSIKVDKASVGDVNFGMNDKGGMNAHIGTANAQGLSYGDTKVNADGSKVVSNASLKSADAKDVGFTKDGDAMGFSVGSADIKDARYGSKTVEKDGSVKDSMNASVGSGNLTGVKGNVDTKTGAFGASVDGANLTDARFASSDKLGNKTNASVGSVDVKDVKAGGNYQSGVYGGSVGSADVKDARYSGTAVGKDGVVTKTGASVDSIGLKGARGVADTKSGMFAGGVDSVDAKDIRYASSDSTGKTSAANVDSAGVKGINAYGNYKEGVYGGGADSLDVKGINYRDSDGKGGSTSAKVDSVTGSGLQGYADTKSGTYGGGFKSVAANGVDVNQTKADGSSMKVKTDYIKAGDGQNVSSIVMNPDGTIKGNIKQIQLGPNTMPGGEVGNVLEMHTAAGKNPDGSEKKASDTKVKLGEKASIGEVKLDNFDPAHLDSKSSSLQVFDIKANKFVVNSDTKTIVGDGAQLDAFFLKGQGNGQVQAGYKGAKLDKLTMDDSAAKEGGLEHLSLEDVNSSGGYAVLNGFKPGQDFGVAYADVKDASVGKVNVKYNIAPSTLEGDQKAYDAKMKAYNERGAYDPKDHQINLGGLGGMSGNAKAKYTYNKEEPGVLDSVGAFFVGRSAEANLEIRNGGVDARTADIGMGETSLLGSTVGGGVLNSFQAGFNGAAMVDGAVNEGGGILTADHLANKFAGTSAEDYNKAPTGPDAKDYNPDGTKKYDRDAMGSLTRIDVDASLDLGKGGDIQWNNDFKGQLQPGGTVQAKGNVGDKLDVNAQNIGMKNIEAGGAKVGEAKIGTVNVTLTNLDGDPTKGAASVDVTVKNGVIKNVQYGDPQSAGSSEADFERLTKR